jgi:hypothetical protein
MILMDKLTQILLDALKPAILQAGEQRLFRSGKLPGIFSAKVGNQADAAAQALRDGLVEMTRQETKGKVTTEWVRVTPRSVEFVQRHESPLEAIRDLHSALQSTRDSLPGWLAGVRQELTALGERLESQADACRRHIEALTERVHATLARIESNGGKPAVDARDVVGWGPATIAYLDKRTASGLEAPCPLSELFKLLLDAFPDLTLTDFHTGLKRLRDRGLVTLVTHHGESALAEPEYALLDGAETFHQVRR